MIFDKGTVLEQGKIAMTVDIPPPPGYAKTFRERQSNIDLTTYDRMRVVTTDLRRIVSEGRDIELRLGPKVSLKRQELVKALKWV